MASSIRRESLTGAATLAAWLIGGSVALAQPGDGATRGGAGGASPASGEGGAGYGHGATGGPRSGGVHPSPSDSPGDFVDQDALQGALRGASQGAVQGAVQGALTETVSSSAQGRTQSLDSGAGRREADQEFARAAMARGTVVPLDRVLKKATDFVPGDVLEVKLRGRPDTAWVYEIRMLSADGRIRLVVVDAARNTVLEVRRP